MSHISNDVFAFALCVVLCCEYIFVVWQLSVLLGNDIVQLLVAKLAYWLIEFE